ncbi:uncharacterized protein [Hetaerina americana]|uniref:uncharacterized protein n=1 Tax=Hetaerina americana TaxID=62018 RepID=UPI003A7F5189
MEPPAGRGSHVHSHPKRNRTGAFGTNASMTSMLWMSALAGLLAALLIIPGPSAALESDNDLVFDDELPISSKHLSSPKMSLLQPGEVAMPDYQLDDSSVPPGKKLVCRMEVQTVKPSFFGIWNKKQKEVEICEYVDVADEGGDVEESKENEGGISAPPSSLVLQRHTRATPDTYDEPSAPADDEDFADGSGDGFPEGSAMPEKPSKVSLTETTIPTSSLGGPQYYRILINVNEPFRDELKDRNSDLYKLIAENITRAVDELYKNTPGRQSSTVIKIEKARDIFFSTVTLDLGTFGYNDTEAIRGVLERQIQEYRSIGDLKVTSDGFVFRPIGGQFS